MKTLRRISTLAIAGLLVGMGTMPAFAADQNWNSSKRHYSIYVTGHSETSLFFSAPTSVSRYAEAKKVTATITPYTGQVGSEKFQVCYISPYGTEACTEKQDLKKRVENLDVTNDFYYNNNSKMYTKPMARGDFKIVHIIDDLQSPIYSDNGRDSITVTY